MYYEYIHLYALFKKKKITHLLSKNSLTDIKKSNLAMVDGKAV